ncbi:MAG: TetR/AcrR family transcriptional regulator [Thermomicrobiales bacterium]
MSPRPYRMDKRQAATDETRARIVTAARDLLATEAGPTGFSVDAIAREAGVARMTIYYQFGAKAGLLDALYDSLASRGGMEHLGAAFQRPDPLAALAEFIAAFGRFWASDRLVLRRLGALSELDPDIAHGNRDRNEWRRHGLRVIVGRIAEQYGRPAPDAIDTDVDILHMLSSFATFDNLAGPNRDPVEVTPLVQRLALASLGLPAG